MCCCRSTPTALDLVVSTLEQPAANAEAMVQISNLRFMMTSQPFPFQGIGKKQARCRRRRRDGEGEPGPARFPSPAGRERAERPARAIADAGEEALPTRLGVRRKHAVHGGD